MNLVDEEDGAAPPTAPVILGFGHHRADFLDPRQDRAEGDEPRAGHARDDAGQRGLAGAGGPPEDDRLQPIALDRPPQRPAGAEEILLPDELVERLRAHPFGKGADAWALGDSGSLSGSSNRDMSISLFRRFVENQRRRDGDVERFDRRAHGDRQPLVGGRQETLRQTRPFAAEQNRDGSPELTGRQRRAIPAVLSRRW